MTYLLLKACHLVCVMLFISSLALSIGHIWLADRQGIDTGRAAPVLRLVSGLSLLGVWAFGLAVAQMGAWFTQPWLLAKLGLVVVLSGLHGMVSARLQPGSRAARKPGAAARLAAIATLCVVAIVLLAVLK